MHTPLDKPIVCPITIGRDPHLAAVDRLLDQLIAGSGQTLLVAGEAGIGKSRLVAETKARAAERGVLVLQGQCFETDRSLPYAPFVDLLRGFTTSHPNLASAELEVLPELVDGPLIVSLGGGGSRAPAGPLPAGSTSEPEQQKRRLFRALTQLIGDLAQLQAVLLVVEDIHWADETSLELLRALARTAVQRRLLVVLTYRNDEVDDSLRGLLTALDRERLSVELRLQRLTLAELDAMLHAIFEATRPGRAEFVDLLYGLTEGNPFFIEEVLRALVGAGDIFLEDGGWNRKPVSELRVPRSVDDAVQRRSAQLSPAARDAIAIAAVAGRRFDFELLSALTGHDEATLLLIVKQLIEAGLVAEESADQLAFRHALTRQAIHGGLLARERRALHRRVAEALEQLGRGSSDDAAADLAYHFAEAGMAEPALGYARRAGARALRMYAPHAALGQLTRALDMTRQLGVAADPELFRLRAQAHDFAGDFSSANADLDAARQAARARGDREAEWRALLDQGLLWAGRDYARSGAYANEALELARAIGDERLLAQTLNRVGNWHMNQDELGEAMRYHQQALGLFEALGDERGRAETLDLLGMASSTDPIGSAGYYAEAIPLLRKLDDRQRLVTSLSMRMVANGAYLYDTAPIPTEVVSFDEAKACGEEALRIAREIEWSAGESFVSWEIGLWLGPRGAYGEALQHAQAGLDIATQIDHRQWMAGAWLTLGFIHTDIYALELAERELTASLALAREVSSANFIRVGAGELATTYLVQRRLDDAAALLDSVVDPEMPMETGGQRMCWASVVDLQLARGDAARALDIADRLAATARPGVAARLAHARGEALAALGRPAEAVDVLRAGLDAAHRRASRGRAWRIQATLARVLRTLGRRDEAEQVLTAARAVLHDLALEIPNPDLRDGFVRATSAIVPPAPAATPARVAKERFGGLTGREREVARLIARGLSNRAIADHLVLGERTIESYVGNILSKLGFTSRTQIAAWAVETGLSSANS
jgi:DNA-binding NarL/FixJ family response regulator